MVKDVQAALRIATPMMMMMMMMMMRRSAAKLVVRTFLWTVCLHFIFTAAEPDGDASPSAILQRQKRTWVWKRMTVYEEKDPQNPPETIGRLKNTLFSKNTQFMLHGEGAGEIFKLNHDGEVLVLKKLDREKKSSYTLKSQILDSNGLILEEDTFIIDVLDINDHTPKFLENFTRSVNEREIKGTVVVKVKANDQDDPKSPNGMVEYSLLNQNNLFQIDSNTGDIRTKVDTLDRETESVHRLVVMAADSSGRGLSSSTVVIININDINDNESSFSKANYNFTVQEDVQMGSTIGKVDITDLDEKQNKNPIFSVEVSQKHRFDLELDENKDGVLIVKEKLDYETNSFFTFTVTLKEHVVGTPDNTNSLTSATIRIEVQDVDEPPVFTQEQYTFNVQEAQKNIIVGSVSAKDPDKSSHRIWYSIQDSTSTVYINRETGQVILKKPLDREVQNVLKLQVTAEEDSMSKQKSYAMVIINVLDINDNDPELANGTNVYICKNDESGTVIGLIGANDVDENPGKFSFTLIGKSSNFSLHDNQNNTASIILSHGGFSEKSVPHVLDIEITDGGNPPRKSITPLHLQVCECTKERRRESCMAFSRSGVSVSALIAILLCIITILVIVILFVLRKRYQKEALVALGKSSGEIHEQLVAYDEEGGGEMDTNVYDVSILTSARSDGRLRLDLPPPAMYAVVKKPPACKGDMAAMIEVKKDEADHDRDGIPYDTLHIYGYEGTESLAGSFSSLESSSSFGSDPDYDFLNDWGPRFRTLAQIYGSDVNHSY